MKRPGWKTYSLLTMLAALTVLAVIFCMPRLRQQYDLWVLSRYAGLELTDQRLVSATLARLDPASGRQPTRVESIDALRDGRILAVTSGVGWRRLLVLNSTGRTGAFEKWMRHFHRIGFSEQQGFPCLAMENDFDQRILFGIARRKIVPVRFEAEGKVAAVWSDDVAEGWFDDLFSANKRRNLQAMAMIPMSLTEQEREILLRRLDDFKTSPDRWTREAAQAAEELVLGPSFLQLEMLGGPE